MICYTLYLNEFMYFRTEESKRSKLHSNHDWYYYAFHSKVIYKFHSKVIHNHSLHSTIGTHPGRVSMKCSQKNQDES